MNRTKLKQLRTVVKNLKLVRTIEEYISVESKTGAELLAAGVKFVGNTGKPVNQYSNYKAQFTKVRALNHVDKMKDFYKKYGEKDTIPKYLAWLDKHHQQMLAKYPDIFNPKKEEVKEIVEPVKTEE